MTRTIPRFRPIAVVAAILVSSIAIAGETVADETPETLDEARQRLAESFEIIDPENINVSPIDGWYQIQKGSIVAYISEDGRYLLQGDLIDLESDINLSGVARDAGRRELMASLDDSQVISFTPEIVRHSVTIFTDTGCTYCRRLHSQIDEYLALGIEVRYVLYPRNGPTSREWATSEQVWCAEDRNRALTAAKLDRDFDTATCDASIVQQHYVLGREVGLNGTPAIVFEDGTLISGYMPPDALIQRLEQQTSSASR